MTTNEFKSIVREWLATAFVSFIGVVGVRERGDCRVQSEVSGPRGLSRGLLAVTLGLVLLTPMLGAPQPSDRYRGTGVVLALFPPPSSLHATRPVIVIQHDPIAGLMDEAMSMPFLAASADLLGPLHAGDRVAFTLQVMPDALLVVGIERVGPTR